MQVGRPYAWEKSYPAGVRWDSPIATSTLQELLDRSFGSLLAATEDYRVLIAAARARSMVQEGVAVER